MKIALSISSKVLLLLFVAVGGLAGVYGKRIHDDLTTLKGQSESQKKLAVQLQKDSKAIEVQLAPDPQRVELTTVLSDTLLAVMRNRVEYGVTIGSLSPHKNTGNASIVEIKRLADPIPTLRDLKSVRFNLRGTYKDYSGLVGYLAELRKLPLAIAYLKVEDATFELGLRVYGN